MYEDEMKIDEQTDEEYWFKQHIDTIAPEYATVEMHDGRRVNFARIRNVSPEQIETMSQRAATVGYETATTETGRGMALEVWRPVDWGV
jgi:hypothetical protein